MRCQFTGRGRCRWPRLLFGGLLFFFRISTMLLILSPAAAFQSTCLQHKMMLPLPRKRLLSPPLSASVETDSSSKKQSTSIKDLSSAPTHHTDDSKEQSHRHIVSTHTTQPLIKDLGISSHNNDHNHHHHAHTDHHTAHTSQIISPNIQLSSSIQQQPSHVLSIEEIKPIFKFEKNGKQKVLNATGLYHLFILLLTMPIWMISMEILQKLGDTIENFDENRAKFDYSGKIWCRTYLGLTGCYPEIDGDVSRLEAGNDTGACLYVANHASFLDIAVLCCVLDPLFKFIAKDSLKAFPGVGKQLVGGEHVLIDRTNKRSQLRTFKQAITYLQNGVPIMAFPEGKRSPDGRLMPFKGGIFSMAVKAKVPIVPLSLANTYAVMPSMGFLPVQSGKGKLRVYVHDPISVDGKSEEEISKEVREALLSELPLDQHPLDEEEG